MDSPTICNKALQYFSGAKALFTGCSGVAHWSRSQACKRPPERTGRLEEHWAPKHGLFARRSSSWNLGRGSQRAGRQAEVGGRLRAEGKMFTQSQLKGGQQTNHGVGLLWGRIQEVPTGLPRESKRCYSQARCNLKAPFPRGVKHLRSSAGQHTLSCPRFPWAQGVQKVLLGR